MSKPQTAAGKALLRDLWGAYAPGVERTTPEGEVTVTSRIAAIERQARAQVLDILRDSFPGTDVAFVEDRLRQLDTAVSEGAGIGRSAPVPASSETSRDALNERAGRLGLSG